MILFNKIDIKQGLQHLQFCLKGDNLKLYSSFQLIHSHHSKTMTIFQIQQFLYTVLQVDKFYTVVN